MIWDSREYSSGDKANKKAIALAGTHIEPL